MTFTELVNLHAETDHTNRASRRNLYAAMAGANRDTQREFTCYLTERGAQGAQR